MQNHAQEEAHLALAEQYIAELKGRIRQQVGQIQMRLGRGLNTEQELSFLKFSEGILVDMKQCRDVSLKNLSHGVL